MLQTCTSYSFRELRPSPGTEGHSPLWDRGPAPLNGLSGGWRLSGAGGSMSPRRTRPSASHEDTSHPCACWNGSSALPTTTCCIPGCLESKECFLGWAGEQELGMGRAGRGWHSRALTAPGRACGPLQAVVNP